MSPTLRFAPSPNGRLHLGHAYCALLNDRIARDLGGTWLLRIEDIDLARAREAHVTGIEEDLAWLGLSWPRPVRRQSRHMAEYRAAADRLRRAGLLYPCFCTRGDVAEAVAIRQEGKGAAWSDQGWPRDPDGSRLYPGTCRGLSKAETESRIARGRPHAWRLDMAAALAGCAPVTWRAFDPGFPERVVTARPDRWGDVVIVRKEVATSYHLCVVCDDAVQGITHVVRGADVEAATDIHALIAARLGLATPTYHHHGLLTDPGGLKLSKSRHSPALRAMREAGETPQSIRRRLGFG